MGSSRVRTVGRVADRRSRVKLIVTGVTVALLASVLSTGPVAVGPADFTAPAAAQAASSTYCENIDDSDPAVGPTVNGGGTSVDITVNAFDLETGTDLSTTAGFSYLVSLDNTARGDDPDPTRHPSVHPMQSHSPTVAAGDELHKTFNVPNGCRYLITVRAPGHTLWGEYVDLPAGTTGPINVDIDMLADAQTAGTPASWPANPDGSGELPIPRDGLPLTKLVVQVFEDAAPTNGQPDFPTDLPLSGFNVTVSAGGETIIDLGGSPLCTHIGGDCITDANGLVTIEGLPPGPYEVHAIPPDGSNWVQTTTIEGTQVIDVWLEAGSDGLGIERALLNEPGTATSNWFGFVQVDEGATPPACGGAVCGEIKGQAVNNLVSPPGEVTVQQSNEPISDVYVAINSIGADDTLERTVRGDTNGNFSVPNLAPGEYQVVLWDEALFYIIGFYTVVVPDTGGVIDMGEVGVFRWFAWLSGYVYLDSGVAEDGTTIDLSNTIAQNGETSAADFAGNGIRDCYDPNTGDGIDPDPYAVGTCELGLPGEEVLIKFRDGSVFKVGITDSNGFYEIPDVRGPLGRYVVPEVGFARRDRTGHSVHHEFNTGGSWDPYTSLVIPGDKGGDLLLASILWEGHRTWVDWGKANYDLSDPAQNGGIAGAVLYGTTINEVEPGLAGQEDYEPGVPNVPLRLWGPGADGDPNNDDDVLLVELSTDAWEHPGDGDGPQPQTAWAGGNDTPCNLLDSNGVALPDPRNIAGLCLEVPANGNETQDGAWDGGFAFEEDCSAGIAALNGGPVLRAGNLNAPAGSLYDESLLDAGLCSHLVPGDFIAQVLVPDFYQIVKEESVNTDEGIELQPQLPPPGCVGELHDVLDPRSPFVGTQEPLCDLKLVRLLQGQNAAVEFTVYPECPAPGGPTGGGCDVDAGSSPQISQRWINDYTGNADEPVPIPARYYGFSEDGLRVDTDPSSLTFGAGFGVPNIPIGIYDFTGRHLTTVHTDVNGYYEFIAPSSYTVSAPTPAGLSPGMWRFVPNDPGPNPAAPNPTFNPTYLTQPWVFQALPGKMRLADTPLFPISNSVCQVEEGTPELLNTSDVYKLDDGQPLDITLTGTAFEDGASAPTVELIDDLGGVTLLNVVSFTPSDLGLAIPVFEDVVVVTVPGALTAGRYRLRITADGVSTVNGVTFHVLAPGTNVITVSETTNFDLSLPQPLQVAVDAATPGTFIDVTVGTYRENVIVDVADLTIQGHGPGGIMGNAAPEDVDIGAATPPESPFSTIPGSVVDSRFFVTSGDAQTNWTARATSAGFPAAPSGATVSILDADDLFIDGLGIGFGRGEAGGGVWANEGTLNLTVSNNIVASAVGEHGGGVVLGRPDGFGGAADQNIDNARISNNRIIQNGGVTFSGGVGIFAGSDGYAVTDNDICGNYSLEYGGGISHFGTSNNGVISGNRVYYNDAFDEGGGIMVAGELRLPANFTPSGNVVIDSNEVSFNLSNDDGGGIRLLAPRDSRIEIVNNFVNHNVANDQGGGIAIDDASDVFIINNTIVENASTATAFDAEAAGPLSTCAPAGPSQLTCPRGAGLTTSAHTVNFTPADGSTFSDAVVRNNIFWNNEAFSWNENGLGLVSEGMWDMEVSFVGAPGCFDVENSFLSAASGPNDACNYASGAGNTTGVDPLVNTDLVLNGLQLLAGNSLVTGADRVLVEIVRGEEPQGAPATFFIDSVDMHLTPGSLAIDAGVDPVALVPTLLDDIDGDIRPLGAQWDIGADEATGGAPVRNTYLSIDCGPLGAAVTCGEDVDIFRVDGTTLVTAFDGTDVLQQGPIQGQSNMNPMTAQIDGFAFLSDTEILISFQRPLHRTMFGLTTGDFLIDDSDVMLFTATQLGGATTGTWSWYFDGSDVGVGGGTGAGEAPNGGEDVDAVGISSTGGLLLSTINTANVGADSFDDSDVFEFTFTGPPGETTAGTFAPFFDGSSADGANGSGLATNPEDVNGFSTDPVNGDLYVSTIAQMRVNENQTQLIAQDDDISTCLAPAGDPPQCSDWQLLLDGASVALDAYDIKGLEVRGSVLP